MDAPRSTDVEMALLGWLPAIFGNCVATGFGVLFESPNLSLRCEQCCNHLCKIWRQSIQIMRCCRK